MNSYENLVNSLTLNEHEVKCIICGEEHDYVDCSLVQIQCYVIDNVVPTKARLTLPHFLQVHDLADGATDVRTNDVITAGTCFGPVLGVKIDTLNPCSQFPLKVFTNFESDSVEGYYLDCIDENECNWMMFINPASECSEQNLVCYQDGDNIFYTTVKQIDPGQSLRVWYSPYYAKRMNTQLLQVLVEERKENLNISSLIKDQQKIMDRQSWNCKFCGKVETDVNIFATHVLEHYKNRRKCEFCNESFKEVKSLKKHMTLCHAESLSDAQRKLLTIKKRVSPQKNKAARSPIGGPLLNDVLMDSLDNTGFLLDQTELMNSPNLLETENTNLTVDNLIHENVKTLDHFNFEIGESEDRHICDICLREFSKVSLLVQHLRRHTGEFLCRDCLTVFPRKENLNSHICNRVATFKCDQCDKVFPQAKYLRRHSISIHSKHRCQKCNRGYSSEETLMKHSCSSAPGEIGPEGEKEFACSECSRTYATKRSLRDHMRKHKSDPPNESINLICQTCGQVFTNRASLYAHVILHKDMVYKCDVCEKAFSNKKNLKEHMKSHDISTESVKCDICDESLKNEKTLKSHKENKHGNNEKFKCSMCSAELSSATNRAKHMRVKHSSVESENNNMHQCPVCDTKTKLLYSLKRHVRQKHPDILDQINLDYNCPVCSLKMQSKQLLNRHIEKAHPEHYSGLQSKNIIDKSLSEIKSMKTSQSGPSDNVINLIERVVPQNVELSDNNSTLSQPCSSEMMDIVTETNLSTKNDICNTQSATNNMQGTNTDTDVVLNTATEVLNTSANSGNNDNNARSVTSSMIYDCDLEFESILNEPNQETFDRFFNFDDIETSDVEHTYVGLTNVDLGNENVGNDAFSPDKNKVPASEGNTDNIIVYVLPQDGVSAQNAQNFEPGF